MNGLPGLVAHRFRVGGALREQDARQALAASRTWIAPDLSQQSSRRPSHPCGDLVVGEVGPMRVLNAIHLDTVVSQDDHGSGAGHEVRLQILERSRVRVIDEGRKVRRDLVLLPVFGRVASIEKRYLNLLRLRMWDDRAEAGERQT